MKKIVAFVLAFLIMLSLIPYVAVTLFAVSEDDGKGLTFVGNSTRGAEEEYYPAKNFEEVPYTFSAWVFLDDTARGKENVILGNYPSASRYTGYINFEITTNGVPRLVWADTDDSHHSDDTRTLHDFKFTKAAVKANEWTYVACVIDAGAGGVHCYINGQLKETIKENFSLPDPTVKDYPIMLGGDLRNVSALSNGNYFKGQLKDVAMYADTRTAAEIARDYEKGADLNNTDLICSYDIDSSDKGKDIADESGNGYHMLYNKMWLTEEEMQAKRGDTSHRAYSFAVISDTQYSTEFNLETLYPIYEWIVDNKEAKNIQYVVGVGDITNTDTDLPKTSYNGPYEWKNAHAAISKLNGVVPYALVRGNHDVYSTEAGGGVESTKGAGFIQYFGGDDDFYAQQYKNPKGYEAGYYEGELANYKGAVETDSVANTWRTLEADGDKWLFVNIDWGAHDDVLAWAGEVIAAHPEHRVIITTHCYLARNGEHSDNRPAGDVVNSALQKGFNNGDGIWEKLASRYTNVEMVLCGHISSRTVVVSQNEGIYGNTVTQLLVDGQSLDRYWGGLGLVAMLYVSKDGKSIDIEYYSTTTGKYLSSMSQRTVNLESKGSDVITKWDGYSSFAPLGSGTENDPYLITCAENLQWMAKATTYKKSSAINPFEGKYFKQTSDIDLNGHTLQQIGCYYSSASAMAVFGGIYDGQGYRIFNGSIARHSSSSQNQKWGSGIFGVTYKATVKNVVADNLTVSGLTCTGTIVGYAVDTQIQNCVATNTCTVIGSGTQKDATTTSSTVLDSKQWNTFSQNRIGGIVGHVNSSEYKYQINYCKSSATILAKGNNAFAGGIAGSLQNQVNMYDNVFDGKIINDFADENYIRTLEGENVNGGIVGYVGSGDFIMKGTNRYVSRNVNKGSFELIGVATTDVIYGGIIGCVKDITPANFRIEYSYNLSNDIDLNQDRYTQTKAIYVGGLVGRVTNSGAATPRSLNLAESMSVDTGIKNGGINVNTSVYSVDNLYVYEKASSGATPSVKAVLANGVTEGAVLVATKPIDNILAKTVEMEKSYEEKREEGLYTAVLKFVGYQESIVEDDSKVRLIFGLDTLDLNRFAFEITTSYVNADGDTVVRYSKVVDRSVFTSFAGKDGSGNDKVYTAGTDYEYDYFAMLVLDPLENVSSAVSDLKVTVTAITVDRAGYSHSYGADAVELVFDANGAVDVK